MPTWGLTSQGFLIKPLSALMSSIQSAQLTGISPNLNLQPPDPLAVQTGIIAAELAELWQVAGALYSGMDPDTAANDQLTGISLITGTDRLAAQPTTVVGCTVNVNAGFSAAPGTMFAYPVGNPAALFTNKETITNAGGTPANETVDFVAVNAGPIQVLASTLTQIGQPLTGWNSITNPTAGVTGTNEESDPDLRLRRAEELSASGATTAAAIKSDVLLKMVPPTTSSVTSACTVLHNDTDATDANGLPPHSIEVIAYQPGNTGADDTALTNLILADKAAGIGTHGTSSTTATDSQGNTETIAFTRPSTTTIYCAITVKTDPTKFNAITGPTAIVSALTNWSLGEWQPGVSVYLKAFQSAVFPSPSDPTLGVPGVLDVTAFAVDTVHPAVATSNITIDVRHVALLSMTTGDVVVT